MYPRRNVNPPQSQTTCIVLICAFVCVNFVVFLYFSRGSGHQRWRNRGGHGKKKMVGFLQMATGKYTQYIQRSHDSFIKHMFVNSSTHDYRLIYFTDMKEIANSPKVLYVHQPRLQWPFDSMNRNEVYLSNRHILEGFDYLIALDIDLVFINHVEPELIINDFVTLRHLTFKKIGQGDFESRPISQAYIPKYRQYHCYYIMGGFFGGTPSNFFKAIETMQGWKKMDEKNNVIPIFHDESYLNRYVCENYNMGQPGVTFIGLDFLRGEPDIITSRDTKVIHMEKKHDEIRGIKKD